MSAPLADEDRTCMECGMVVDDRKEYHPYAACLMFKGCHNGSVVRANLDAVIAYGYQRAHEERQESMR